MKTNIINYYHNSVYNSKKHLGVYGFTTNQDKQCYFEVIDTKGHNIHCGVQSILKLLDIIASRNDKKVFIRTNCKFVCNNSAHGLDLHTKILNKQLNLENSGYRITFAYIKHFNPKTKNQHIKKYKNIYISVRNQMKNINEWIL